MCQSMWQLLLLFLINNKNNKCLKKGTELKPKESKIGDKNNIYKIHLLKLLDYYNMVGLTNNLLSPMRSHYRVVGLDYLIIQSQPNRLKIIKLVMQTNNLLFKNMLLSQTPSFIVCINIIVYIITCIIVNFQFIISQETSQKTSLVSGHIKTFYGGFIKLGSFLGWCTHESLLIIIDDNNVNSIYMFQLC